MGKRKALLIGVEEYGDGFENLAAVAQDIQLVGTALDSRGFEVELIKDPDKAFLDEKLRDFCEDCGADDTFVLYFSGHGTSDGQFDYIVPANVRRSDAEHNDNFRIRTNLSDFIEGGLFIYIIDACRDTSTTAKGFGKSFGYEEVGGLPLVRFFGCHKGEICQILPEGHNGQDVSVFSKALSAALEEDKSESLDKLLQATTKNCQELANSNNIKIQQPHLSYGETTPGTQEILGRSVFRRKSVFNSWEKFDTQKMHCILIKSEFEHEQELKLKKSSNKKHGALLEEIVIAVVSGLRGARVWKKFCQYADGNTMLNGQVRKIPTDFDDDESVNFASFSVSDVFRREIFADAVRGLVEADLAIFDVTGFEPGVMLLMGIRSASRRGLSISTHGRGWRELQDIEPPFNLRDLSIGSHTVAQGGAGPDPVREALQRRIEAGFLQLSRQPRYQDLPAYDPLRQLGPVYEAAATIPVEHHILALVSYGDQYLDNWDFLANTLGGQLSKRLSEPKICRLIDLGNPQIVSQALYEQIRRVAGCIVDWTEFSPSTLFEMGVRLATSEYGALLFIDARYLPGEALAERWESMSRQIGDMYNLFKPFVYQLKGDKGVFKEAALELINRTKRPQHESDEFPEYNFIYRRVSESIENVEEAHIPVFRHLADLANSLHHPKQGAIGAPQIMFRYRGTNSRQLVKHESERAALELRLAAWLYLHHRMSEKISDANHPYHGIYTAIGHEVANALFESDLSDDLKFGQMILKELQEIEEDA